jgi:hypothetical protein
LFDGRRRIAAQDRGLSVVQCFADAILSAPMFRVLALFQLHPATLSAATRSISGDGPRMSHEGHAPFLATTFGNRPPFGNQQFGFGVAQIEHVSDSVRGHVDTVEAIRELSRQPNPHHISAGEWAFIGHHAAESVSCMTAFMGKRRVCLVFDKNSNSRTNLDLHSDRS